MPCMYLCGYGKCNMSRKPHPAQCVPSCARTIVVGSYVCMCSFMRSNYCCRLICLHAVFYYLTGETEDQASHVIEPSALGFSRTWYPSILHKISDHETRLQPLNKVELRRQMRRQGLDHRRALRKMSSTAGTRCRNIQGRTAEQTRIRCTSGRLRCPCGPPVGLRYSQNQACGLSQPPQQDAAE